MASPRVKDRTNGPAKALADYQDISYQASPRSLFCVPRQRFLSIGSKLTGSVDVPDSMKCKGAESPEL